MARQDCLTGDTGGTKIWQWFHWLTPQGLFRANPIASVKAPRYSVDEGKTPVLEAKEARALFESISGDDIVMIDTSQTTNACMLDILVVSLRPGAIRARLINREI